MNSKCIHFVFYRSFSLEDWKGASAPREKMLPFAGGKGKPVGNTVQSQAYWEGREGGVAVTVLSRCWEMF